MANARARIVTIGSIAYMFDRDRNKHLSLNRHYLRAGLKSRTATNQFLRVEDGTSLMSVGDLMPRNGTIVGISANCESMATWTVEIFKNGSEAPIASLPISDAISGKNQFNVDFTEGDTLSIKASGVNIPVPRVLIEIAWRL